MNWNDRPIGSWRSSLSGIAQIRREAELANKKAKKLKKVLKLRGSKDQSK